MTKERYKIMAKEINISDRAADKLSKELERAEKVFKGTTPIQEIKRAIVGPVCKMLTKFCYQDEEFAQAVLRCEKELIDNVAEIVKDVTRSNPSISDVEAYVRAVRFYLPAAEVTVSFRILLPNEYDDDLLDLGAEPKQDTEGQAIILDLLDTREDGD